jgi:hypothetical protein
MKTLAIGTWISERVDSISARKLDESQVLIRLERLRERFKELVFIHLNFHPNGVDENSSCSDLD